MAGEIILVLGTTKTLVSSGASLANNTMSGASSATYGVFTDGGGFPDALFVLAGAFGTAPTANTTLDLYARELDVDGTNDTQAPTTSYRVRYIGSFILNSVTTTQYLTCVARDVPVLAEYYLHNNGSGQTLSSGWTLKVTPRTYKAA